jgi:hypothetical protein
MARVTLKDAWDYLCAVRVLQLSARSNGPTSGWSGNGTGTVTVTITDTSTITFTERGSWIGDCGKQLDFNNCYRWMLVEDAGIIRLEHLRHGPDLPVLLLDLAPTDDAAFESVSSHRCGADSYSASMKLGNDVVYLRWRVKGPKKIAEIFCTYRQQAN